MRVRSLMWAALLALAACASPEPVTEPTPPRRTAPGRVTARLRVERIHARAAVVTVTVDIEPGWRIYGLNSSFGVPPRLDLRLPRGVAFGGSLVEPTASREVALDELPITAHRGRVTFSQRLELADDGPASVASTFTWQVCDEADTFCAPGRADATLVIAGVDGRAPGPWELGDERASVTATIERDGGGRCLLRLSINGRADWWVEPQPLELEAPFSVEHRRVEPLVVELIAPPGLVDRAVHLTVRWRGQTAGGTPGEGSASASLPLPPP